MKKLLNHPVLKFLRNKYVLVGLFFVLWMIFLDTNNYFVVKELGDKIEDLEQDIEFYQNSLATDSVLLKELENNPEAFEKYARENFGMHRPGETVTIIESKTEE